MGVVSGGKLCILDVDVQGCQNIHEGNFFETVKFVFVKPPSMVELERRLRGRGTETEEKIKTRLANAVHEIEFAERVNFFDHTFVLERMTDEHIPQCMDELCDQLVSWF